LEVAHTKEALALLAEQKTLSDNTLIRASEDLSAAKIENEMQRRIRTRCMQTDSVRARVVSEQPMYKEEDLSSARQPLRTLGTARSNVQNALEESIPQRAMSSHADYSHDICDVLSTGKPWLKELPLMVERKSDLELLHSRWTREASAKSNAAHIDNMMQAGWERDDAADVPVLASNIYAEPMARALPERDSTYRLVGLLAKMMGRTKLAEKLYQNLQGRGSLVNKDPQWAKINISDSTVFRGFVCSSAISATNHPKQLKSEGFAPNIGGQHIPHDGPVVLCTSSEADEHTIRSAVMTNACEGRFPPNTLFTLKRTEEPGAWEAENDFGEKIRVQQKLLVVSANYMQPKSLGSASGSSKLAGRYGSRGSFVTWIQDTLGCF